MAQRPRRTRGSRPGGGRAGRRPRRRRPSAPPVRKPNSYRGNSRTAVSDTAGRAECGDGGMGIAGGPGQWPVRRRGKWRSTATVHRQLNFGGTPCDESSFVLWRPRPWSAELSSLGPAWPLLTRDVRQAVPAQTNRPAQAVLLIYRRTASSVRTAVDFSSGEETLTYATAGAG